MTFWTVCGLGVLALVGVWRLVPRQLAAAPQTGSGWGILRRPQLLLALLLTATSFGGVFASLTFISPLLHTAAGLTPGQISATLLVFGLGLTLGNTTGGWLADRWPTRSMFGILLALVLVEAAVRWAASHPIGVVVAVFFWGVATFATVPGLQSRVLDQGSDAPALASTFNIGAFNLGNAAGAWLGASALERQFELIQLPLLSAGLAVVALGVLALGSISAGNPRRRKPSNTIL